ncbi:MAG TPA: TraR/DksA C4-type zinc finger protein [Acidobacteriota bacterium]|jgi:DnaK suppressor protein|nr:TraR/DksA C4-type zinc finger protein [Acidobacteriota bacterium]
MDETMLKQFETKLKDRRREILARLENFEEALAYLEQSRPPEFSEEAQEEAVANSLKALDEREWQELKEINAALERIRRGVYGICEECEEEIALPRLNAVPTARLCITCQRKAEQRR